MSVVSPPYSGWPKVESPFKCESCRRIFIILFERPDGTHRNYCNRCRDAIRRGAP